MSENKYELSTLVVNGPNAYEQTGGVIFEITDGKKVIMQLKTDGTLLMLMQVRIKTVVEIETCQSKFDEIGGYPLAPI